jgi:Tfp pilus assembly protein PilF
MIQHSPLRPALAAILVLALAAPQPAEAGRSRKPEALPDLSLESAEALLERGVAALRANDPAAARQALSELASRQPRNGTAQALLGLSYQLAAERDPSSLDLALAGYDIAMRSEPGLYWPAAMAGRAAFDQGKY